jgi:hypothetical protein
LVWSHNFNYFGNILIEGFLWFCNKNSQFLGFQSLAMESWPLP